MKREKEMPTKEIHFYSQSMKNCVVTDCAHKNCEGQDEDDE